ncbi:hypothetical protein ACDA63_19205 [Uliginosibacterium sp. sgz301328]|uniref:hypothetical protein n=1 Tax=Uliginosibacterium sp. sgz301328 TaxID=3243764 RepID=UPI00359D6967
MRYLSAEASELNQNQPLPSRSALANSAAAAEDDEAELLAALESALLDTLDAELLDALEALLDVLDVLDLELELADEETDEEVPDAVGVELSSPPQALSTAAASKANTRPE